MLSDLEKIYLERENKMIELMKTMSWEEARKIVDSMDFQERIDKIVYHNGKKKEFEKEVGKQYPIFRIIDIFNDSPHNLASKTLVIENGKKEKYWYGPTINKQPKYCRLLIKRIGYELDLGGGYAEVILDNADDEDYEWYMKMSINSPEQT